MRIIPDSKQCVINEVRVNPCRDPSRCAFKRGESVEFSFDFTPEFTLDTAKNKVYAKINGEYVDWIGGLEENACGAVQCPLTSNTKSTYTKAIKLNKSTQAVRIFLLENMKPLTESIIILGQIPRQMEVI